MTMHIRIPTLATLMLSTALSACATTGPALVPPPQDIPMAWEQPSPENAPIWPEADWWQGFGSPELNTVISSVESDNLSLAAAEQRILQADARLTQAGAALLPSVGVSLGGNRRVSGGDNGSTPSNSFSANASVSYEFDFWGANRAGVTAARAAGTASRADRETVALTAVSGAANTYFQLLSIRNRLDIARLNLDIARSVLQVTESRVRNGVATPLELSQQLGAIASQQAAIPNLEQQELTARAGLAVLLGRPPEGFDVMAQNLDAIQMPPVAPGLPSELLVRRPDIVAAEANLEGAHANIIAARAALFPSISLSAGGGASSASLISLVSNPGLSLSLGASLAQSIFDADSRQAQVEAAQSREIEVLANYRSVVIGAFSEVEIALGNVANLTEQERFQIEQAMQAQVAFDIVQARYREGVADFLTVLDAQRTLYQSRDSLGQIKLSRLQALVTLYRALGGGWRAPDED